MKVLYPMPAPILYWIAQYGPSALFGLLTLGVFGPAGALFAYGAVCLWSSVFVLPGWYVGDEWQVVLEA